KAGQRQQPIPMIKAQHLREPRVRSLALRQCAQRLAARDGALAGRALRLHRDEREDAIELECVEVRLHLRAKTKRTRNSSRVLEITQLRCESVSGTPLFCELAEHFLARRNGFSLPLGARFLVMLALFQLGEDPRLLALALEPAQRVL